MTTVELRTSIMAELDLMSVEMLESVSHYVNSLRRHSRPARRGVAAISEQLPALSKGTKESEVFTPRVMRFKRGNPWFASDEEVDRLRHEYLTEKYK